MSGPVRQAFRHALLGYAPLRSLSRLAIALLLAIAGGAVPAVAHAQGIGNQFGISPFEDWQQVTTAHFRITYPKRLSAQLERVARYAEEAHQTLAPQLYWEPRYRMHILMLDNTDFANGLAAPVQRIGMVLWITPPEQWFSTSFYDDWLRTLVFHEYTHILNMDATRDSWKALRVLFGDTLLPNSIWPVWMLEGLAVYMETRHTRAGRGRSPLYEMVLRAAVEEGKLDHPDFVTLDRVNGSTPWYPGGETPYLFGFEIMNHISQNSLAQHPRGPDGEIWSWDGKAIPIRSSEDQLGVLSLRSSWRVPFFINGNAINVTGKSFTQHWSDWVTQTRTRMQADLAAIRREPLTAIERLTERGFQVLAPVLSPNGRWLAYSQDSSDHRPGLYRIDLSKPLGPGERPVIDRIGDKLGGAGMAFAPDSRHLFVSEVDVKSVFHSWSDLGVWDLERRSFAWLSDGLRARDPDVDRDGKRIVYVRTVAASHQLWLSELLRNERGEYRLGRSRRLFDPGSEGRVALPRFSPDGTRVAFALKRAGEAGERVMELEIATQITTPTLSPESDGPSWERFPSYGAGGELYFVSSASGVDNVYVWDRTQTRPRRLTNVTTGIWYPVQSRRDPQEFFGSVFSTGGFDLARFRVDSATDAARLNTRVTSRPVIGPVVAEAAAPDVTAETPPSAAPAVEISPASRYSIWSTLAPRTWSPVFIASQESLFVGGAVLGYDALDLHRYIGAIAYDTGTKRPDGLLSYTNRQLAVELSGLFSVETRNRQQGSSGVEAFERRKRLRFDAGYPLQWTWTRLRPSIGFNLDQNSQLQGSNGEFRATSRDPTERSLDAQLSYSNAVSSRLAISAEGGRSGSLGVRAYDDGGDRLAFKVAAVHQEFIPLSKHSVLMPFVKGTYVTRTSTTDLDPFAQLTGRNPRLLSPFDGDGLDQITLRGYPSVFVAGRSAAVAGLEYRFPMDWIFRGLGTNPLFFETLRGVGFTEVGYLPSRNRGIRSLPAAGLGLRLDAQAFVRIPVTLGLDYHYGFRRNSAGLGGSDLFVSVLVSQSFF